MVTGVRGVADVGPVRTVGDERTFAPDVLVAVVELFPERRFRFVVKAFRRVGAVIG